MNMKPVGNIRVREALRADESYRAYFNSYPAKAFLQQGFMNPLAQSNLTIRLEAAVATTEVMGDVVQCGVYRGGSLGPLAWLVQKLGPKKRVWGFDSFQGFPTSSAADHIRGVLPEKAQSQYFADTHQERVEQALAGSRVANVNLVAGSFETTLPAWGGAAISLLILDCDLYDSYRLALRSLYDRVTSGGIIILDEYYSPKYPGARQAVDEFFADKPEKPLLAREYLAFHPYERWYVSKS